MNHYDRPSWIRRFIWTFNWSLIFDLIFCGLAIGGFIYLGVYVFAPFKIKLIWN